MQAAAEVIRATDGAGIVARLPPDLPEPDAEALPEEVDADDEAEPTLAGWPLRSSR